MTKKISIMTLMFVALILSSSSFAKEDAESDQIVETCSISQASSIRDFEQRTGFQFKNAVSAEMKMRKVSDFKSSKEIVHFCNNILGEKYGRVRFSSKPQGARIVVGGDAQSEDTNIEMAFKVGSYAWEISFKDQKKCHGQIVVLENKTIKVHCNKSEEK